MDTLILVPMLRRDLTEEGLPPNTSHHIVACSRHHTPCSFNLHDQQGSTLTVDRRPEATKIWEGPLKTHN
jgi:hypothetical protein